MDEKRSGYSLKAQGSSGAPLHLPGLGSFPRVDDHLVEPEVTRDEIINGQRVVAMPAEAPHAIWHGDLQYVLRAHVAPGYCGAADLLTRQGADFSTDVCIYTDGVDPSTGTRYLEEMTFEVVSEHGERDVTEKAVEMYRRGVRRIFAVFVEGPRRGWPLLDAGSWIEDRCLVSPLAVAALLDSDLADNAVAEALVAKGNPIILNREAAAVARGKAEGHAEGKAEGRVEGKTEGIASSILAILEERGIAVSAVQ